MFCGFAMGTDGPIVRQCEPGKCAMWVATGKGQCVFVTLPKKLTFIGDMLSGIDDKLEAIVQREGEKEDV